MLDFTTLAQRALQDNPTKTALIIDNKSISYAEFEQMIEKHAACLAAQNLQKGDRVGLLSYNHQDLAAMIFAAWRIGCVVVPLNHLYQGPEVEFAAEHSSIKLLLIQDGLAQGLSGNLTLPPCVENCFTFETTIEGVGTPWRDEMAKEHPAATAKPLVEGDPAAIYFTSGSTSKPKGVTHTAHSILETGRSRGETMELSEDDTWLLSTQLVHVSASLGSLIPSLMVGGTVVFLEEFSPEDWLTAFGEHAPTRSVILPSLLHDILDCPALDSVDFDPIRSMECVGDFVTPDLYDKWGEVSESIPLSQLIGMTECEGYCGIPKPGVTFPRGSAGKPRTGVEVRVVDSEGNDAPTGEIGELCIRSNSMTVGYWQDPKNTSLTIRDGWLFSGDQGRIDEDQNIWFVGREKEIIVKRGSNIAPGEVESVLDQHPDIAESAVIGTPPGVHGQRVVAFVETEPGRTLDTAAAAQWASEKIGAFKLPDEWIVVDALPRNPVGKLDRAELHRRTKSLFPNG